MHKGMKVRTKGQHSGKEVQYRGVTVPKIPRVSETEPTFHREGSHVLVGRGGGELKPDFVSSHKTKQARVRVS